jgi:hypothetical protein
MPHKPTVLVVSDDLGLSDQVGGWLEEAAMDVLLCPGPSAGGCIGLSGSRCALQCAADAAVVDLHPLGDSFLDASHRKELARYYISSGTTVLVLTDDTSQLEQPGLVGAASLGRFADRQQVTETVRALVTEHRLPRQQHLVKES